MSATAAIALQADALAVAVPGRTLCNGLALAVRPGECWVVVGPNGAGKTTLLATLAGLRTPAAGAIAYDGVPITSLTPRQCALKRAWLPQASIDFFPATALETVLVGRHPHLSRWGWESASDMTMARVALAAVGLAGWETREVGTLSGGERRRVAIAALLAQDADLMLLDEPSAHLDLGQQIVVLDFLTRLARERNKALVMVLHDIHLALRYGDGAIAIGNGHVVAGPAAAVLDAAALSTLFGHPLVAVGSGNARTLLPA